MHTDITGLKENNVTNLKAFYNVADLVYLG